ncbi:MAG TPA: hypothetical protein VGK59_18370 [Ohtaekwangia sp.]
MKQNFLKSLLGVALALAISVSFVSCSDDDDFDCDSLEDKVDDKYEDIDEAYLDEDCEKIDDLFDDVVSLIKKGKNCTIVKEAIEDGGYDDVDDFIENEIEPDREDYLADCP